MFVYSVRLTMSVGHTHFGSSDMTTATRNFSCEVDHSFRASSKSE